MRIDEMWTPTRQMSRRLAGRSRLATIVNTHIPLTLMCCGFVVQQAVQQIHNKSN